MRISLRAAAVLAAGVLALSLATAGSAQQRPGRRAAGLPAAIVARLNLNADQQAKLKTAQVTLAAEAQKTQSLTGQERRDANRKAREAFDASLKEILTPDQQKQLDSLRAEMREYRDLGPGMSAQLAGLNLSVEQKAKVKEIAAKYQPELQKLRQALRDATDKQQVQGQIREQQMKMGDEVRAILTPTSRSSFAPPRAPASSRLAGRPANKRRGAPGAIPSRSAFSMLACEPAERRPHCGPCGYNG